MAQEIGEFLSPSVALSGRLTVGDVDREALGVLDAGAQQALGHLPSTPPAGVPGVEAVGGNSVGFDHDGGSSRAQVIDQPLDPAAVVLARGGALARGASA